MVQLSDEDAVAGGATDYTWGEFSEDIDKLVAVFSRLIPPTELEEYHNAHVNVWSTWGDNAQQRPPQDSFIDDFETFAEDLIAQLIKVELYSDVIEGELEELFEQAEEQKLRDFYGDATFDADYAAQVIFQDLPLETRLVLEREECAPLLYVAETEQAIELQITPTDPTTPETDREALMALYNATDGPSWTDNTNWLSDAPIGEWFGVTTDEYGRVVELILNDNMLSGPIPAEVGNLTHLVILNLGDNQLRGAIPPAMGNLLGLWDLSLYSNQLTGQIPPELGTLSLLVNLFLLNNQLSGEIPPELGNLERLWSLWLSGNDFSGCIPTALERAGSNDFAALGLPFCE